MIMLMLSGGKDSSSLAFDLMEVFTSDEVLLFVNDHGFMSDTAKENIQNVQTLTGCELLIHEATGQQLKIVERFFANQRQKLQDVCGKCTKVCVNNAAKIAHERGIRTVVTGNTKYNFFGASRPQTTVSVNGDVIRFNHPHVENYDYKRVIERCNKNGIAWDPVYTNCLLIRSILRIHFNRFKYNPYRDEMQELYEAGHIDDAEVRRLDHFCTGRPTTMREVF